MNHLAITAFGATDQGKVRRNNEDAFGLSPAGARIFWAAVCDGMGGHEGGEVAASEALASVAETVAALPATALSAGTAGKIFTAANAHVLRQQQATGLIEMGATMVALFIDPARRLGVLAHAGDARGYRFRANCLQSLTSDHNMAEELRRELGEHISMPIHPLLSNRVTRFLGMEDFPGAEVVELPLQPGDLFLLASDGLQRVIPDSALPPMLMNPEPEACVKQLIALTLAGGAPDNVTVVVVKVADPPAG